MQQLVALEVSRFVLDNLVPENHFFLSYFVFIPRLDCLRSPALRLRAPSFFDHCPQSSCCVSPLHVHPLLHYRLLCLRAARLLWTQYGCCLHTQKRWRLQVEVLRKKGTWGTKCRDFGATHFIRPKYTRVRQKQTMTKSRQSLSQSPSVVALFAHCFFCISMRLPISVEIRADITSSDNKASRWLPSLKYKIVMLRLCIRAFFSQQQSSAGF